MVYNSYSGSIVYHQSDVCIAKGVTKKPVTRRFQKFGKFPRGTGKVIRQTSELEKCTPPHKAEIFPVQRCYRHRIIGILKVDGGHVAIFFNELDDCVKGCPS